ncbi:type IX secretion system protein PorQ [Chitinophagaceae bacterium MMS25-I14]
MLRLKRMQFYKWALTLLLGCSGLAAQAQVTGGQQALEFLRMPNGPQISALGSINVSNPSPDISFALQNPALMAPELHNQLGLNYNAYYAGISVMNLNYGYHVEKIQTSFALGIQYLNYGNFTQTDDVGNIYGDFKAHDYAISVAASRKYGEHWRYGATLKLANSSLYDKKESALLADVGINYTDTSSLWTIGAVAKNMGVTLRKYNPDNTAEPLPFDLQIGVSKRFKHLPLRLMATIHHLYEWDIRYNNPADIETTNLFGSPDSSASGKSHFGDKLFRHFIFGAELLLGKRLAITVGYNHMRRQELALQDRTALSGFSFGASLYLNKIQVHYARSYYNITGAYNEFGLNFALNKLIGMGKGGEKINWNKDYSNP